MSTFSTLLLTVALAVASCADKTPPPAAGPTSPSAEIRPTTPAPATIIGVARAAGSFHTLLAAIDAAGLTATLEGSGPFTVFAPTDAAFAKIPKADLDALLANKDRLRAVLTFHVVSGKLPADALLAQKTAHTLEGEDVRVEMRNGRATVNDSNIVTADVAASNGIVHVIDTVLIPKRESAQPQARR